MDARRSLAVSGLSLPLHPLRKCREAGREELGFQGLILTDALNMKAVTERYGSGRACLMALEAGCHVLLMPENPREAFDTIREAVLSGSFPEERLDEAVTHILSFKLSHRILK